MPQHIAIIQRQTLHTEIMGAIAAYAHTLGYDVSLFYNTGDPWEMATYFSTRMPWIKEIADWTVLFNRPSDAYTHIVLNTSDEWLRVPRKYRRQIDDWCNQGRIKAIHHDICYIASRPTLQTYVGLTPAFNQWIFPLYSAAYTKPEIASVKAVLPTLCCVGSLDSKDREDVGRYIQAGGTVANYVRYPATDLIEKYDRFHNYSNLSGANMMDELKEVQFMWFPIIQTSSYAVDKFTGSLTLGVDIGAILVMPKVLQEMYGFPEDGVITYKDTVTESLDALRSAMLDSSALKRAFGAWRDQAWLAGLDTMSKFLSITDIQT
jgi:hypothetical protein